jgi:hypothetical protein
MSFLPSFLGLKFRFVWGFVRGFLCKIVLGVDALFSYRTDNRIAIRFAANRTAIRTGNRIRVAFNLIVWLWLQYYII